MLEDVDQRRVARDVREHPQLDLAVVGDQKQIAVAGAEGAPHLAPDLGTDRDVLQVRVVRRKPSGRRHRLVVAGVQATVGRDEVRQCVDVGRLQLGQLAVLQHLGGRVVALPGELFQDVGAGLVLLRLARAAGRRQAHVLEQDDAELLRRQDVEALAGKLEDLIRQLAGLPLEPARHVGKHAGVEFDALLLHRRQHGHQGRLDLFVHLARARRLLPLRSERLEDQGGKHRLLRRVDAEPGVLAQSRGFLTQPRVGRRRRLVEKAVEGNSRQSETPHRGVDEIGHQHRVDQARGNFRPAVPMRTEADDLLQVVPDQFETGVGQPSPQLRRHGFPQARTPEIREEGPACGGGSLAALAGRGPDRSERQPDRFAAAPKDDADRDSGSQSLDSLLEGLDALQDHRRLDLRAAALALEFLEQAPELELAAQFPQRLEVRRLHL